MQYAKLFNASVICAIIICLIWPIKIDGQALEQIQNITLVHKCDIVLIVDDSWSIKHFHPGGDDNFERMLGVVRKFPDYFVMGEDHTRVAIIVFSLYSRILLNLTADDNLVRNFSTEPVYGTTYTGRALKDAKEKVFANARPEAMRIVILIADGHAADGPVAVQTAKELRDEGTQIYVAFIGQDYYNKPKIKDQVENITGDPANVFPIDAFDNLTAAIFEKIIHEIKCKYQEGCRFNDSTRQSCVGEYWRAAIGDTNCTNIPPTEPPSIQCVLEDCQAICDRWPWEERECQDEDAGKNLTINRGPKPEGNDRMFEHCPKENVKMCPLTTTESPKPTEVTEPTTESLKPTVNDPTTESLNLSTESLNPTVTDDESTTESPKRTSNEPTTESLNPTSNEATMESLKPTVVPTTESLNPTEPLTTMHLPSTEKAAVAETESSSSVVTKWWFILVMVIIALLILTGIVFGVISVNRKRKKAEETASMEKKKASEKRKVTVEKLATSNPPSTISDRQPHPKQPSKSGFADQDLESPGGKGPVEPQMIQFGYEQGGGADQSLQVSLLMDPKKTSSSGKSDEVKSINSSMNKSARMKACVVKRAKKSIV